MSIQDLIDDFTYLDDWEDRYRYVIELGKKLPDFDEALKTDENKVRGCVSQVWLVSEVKDAPEGGKVLVFTGDSDAHIVRGLIAILFELYSGQTAKDILEADPKSVFHQIGLDEHLSPQRSNGLAAMVKRIQADASAAMAAS